MSLATRRFLIMNPITTGRRDSLTTYRTYLRKRCNCFGRKCSLARLKNLGVRPFRL